MAKAEFYEIIIKNKEDDKLINIDFIDKIKNILSKLNDNDLLCNNKTCMAILSKCIHNDNSSTFDFSKLTNEIIKSTIVSKPLDSINTFEELNKMESDKANPTEEEINYIIKISSEYEDDELIEKLINSDIAYFTIYKIFMNNKDLITKNELSMFCKKTIQRMKKEKIFFNIFKIDDNYRYILIFQKAVHGFDVKHLDKYLNTHLLINDDMKISFKKIYDVSFMDALQNSDIKNFKFTYNEDSKNNLLDDNFATPLYFLNKLIGSSVTISVNNDGALLDNKKLLNFFELANKEGLLKSCKIRKQGMLKEIDSNEDGLELSYATKSNIENIENIEQSNSFFLEAFKNKEGDLREGMINL